MLRKEQNDLLCQTGPGTPMGQMFRLSWQPALLAEELPENECPPVRVKLLGERLLAWRDTQGNYALTDEFCAHRGVSLWFGRNEHNGLRCPYHGWKYDHTGQCIEVPSEPSESGYCKKVKLMSGGSEGSSRSLLRFSPISNRKRIAAMRVELCKADQVSTGTALRVEAGGLTVAVFNIDGQFYVTDDACTHGPGSLSEGFIEGDAVECNFHNGQFNIKTGEIVSPPCMIPVRTYPTMVEGKSSLRRNEAYSPYGMTCPQCNDLMIAPSRSAYVSCNSALHCWSCDTCGHDAEIFDRFVRLSGVETAFWRFQT